jgi:hypothetical protein
VPRSPECCGAEADEQESGREGEQAGVVVPGRADLEAVVAGLARSGGDAEQAERDRRRPPHAGAHPRVGGRKSESEDDWHEAADEVVASRAAGLGLDEVVVQQVQHKHGGRGGRDGGLTAHHLDVHGQCSREASGCCGLM